MRRARMPGGVIAALAAVLLAAWPASAALAASSQIHAVFRAPAAVGAALPAPVPCNTSAGSCWQPPLVATWQYQLLRPVHLPEHRIHQHRDHGHVVRDRKAGRADSV